MALAHNYRIDGQTKPQVLLNLGRVDRLNLDGPRRLAASINKHFGDAALGYKNLLVADRGFRDLKSTLLLRPVFHRLEHRIRAHVLICWLALLLVRVAERGSGHTCANINRQRAIYQAFRIDPPPRITTFDPT